MTFCYYKNQLLKKLLHQHHTGLSPKLVENTTVYFHTKNVSEMYAVKVIMNYIENEYNYLIIT